MVGSRTREEEDGRVSGGCAFDKNNVIMYYLCNKNREENTYMQYTCKMHVSCVYPDAQAYVCMVHVYICMCAGARTHTTPTGTSCGCPHSQAEPLASSPGSVSCGVVYLPDRLKTICLDGIT